MKALKGDIKEMRAELMDEVNLRDYGTGELLKMDLKRLRGNITRCSNKLARIEEDPTASAHELRHADGLRDRITMLVNMCRRTRSNDKPMLGLLMSALSIKS